MMRDNKPMLISLLVLAMTAHAFALSLQTNLVTAAGKVDILYSCKGKDSAPSVQWQAIPPRTKSLVVTLDDPDASSGLWAHWAVWNIPPTVTALTPGIGVIGANSWGNARYQGPCPPFGEHRYYLKLYALDTMLTLPAGSRYAVLQQSIAGHIIATAQVMGVMTLR